MMLSAEPRNRGFHCQRREERFVVGVVVSERFLGLGFDRPAARASFWR